VRIRSLVVAAFAVALVPVVVRAQTPALGPELQVNTYTTGHQAYPGIAVDDSGQFLIVWDSVGQDGNQRGVYARLFDRQGSPLTGEVPVNTYTTGNQHSAAVAAVPSVGFVVVWQDNSQDGSGSGIFGRLLDAAGAPVGGEFPVNEFTTSAQEAPRVGADDSGNFVVVWQSFSQDDNGFTIVARRFGSDADPLGGDLIVNQYTTGNQVSPDVSMGPSGEFVVVWESPGQDGDVEGIFARRYDNAGSPVSSEIAVNTHTTGSQTAPSVALASTGEFVVAWQSLQDGSQTGIRGRAFDEMNVPLVDEVAVNTFTTGAQESPRVAVEAERIHIVWESVGQEPGSADRGVFLRVFGDGLPAPEFQLNVFTNANQITPAIAASPDGQFVAAWQSLGQDAGGSFGVFARRGGYPGAQPVSVDSRPSSGASNVNGVLEVGETVAVDPAWSNLAGASLTLSGTAADFGGPAGPVYSLLDTSADYGTILSSGAADCFSATMNCYELRIDGGPRPASHWDATFDEALDTGVTKTWTLHVGESFADVPASNLFYAFIENIFHNGITAGGACGGYCPIDATLRKQMAVFVLKSEEGPLYVPPPATGVFDDVPASDPFAPWIEDLYARGVVAGCAAPGGLTHYCPDDPVLRQQMAVFLLRTREGSGYAPPGCLGIFMDVPCPGLFTDWIEELANRGIAAGCGGASYCPANPTTRGQMAPFLTKTFGLQLYGP
jgi:hypothetical protein